MSKALRYLAAARPDAATHLLSFYKHSVKALDDKTRHLIQIVTKVTVGTERGLRQYAPKALKAGASKEEILDAVLMAFPAAGLNKVLDAINVLIELELLPEAGESGTQTEGDRTVGALADFPLKRLEMVNRPDGDLLVFRTDDENVRVYSARCPHRKANLSKGVNHGTRIECHVHNWTFDMATGDCIDPEGEEPLIEVPVTVVDGKVTLA